MPTGGEPAATRVAVAGRTGAFGVGGVKDLRRFYAPQAMASVHYEWRTLPVTSKMIRALRDLALSHPPVAAPYDNAVQYGMTIGLSMAADLLDDPALLLRGLFGEQVVDQRTLPDETFDEPSTPE